MALSINDVVRMATDGANYMVSGMTQICNGIAAKSPISLKDSTIVAKASEVAMRVFDGLKGFLSQARGVMTIDNLKNAFTVVVGKGKDLVNYAQTYTSGIDFKNFIPSWK